MVDKLDSKYWYWDGRKSILLEQYPDEAWTFLSNGPQNDGLDNFKFIPTLYRAATIRGNEIAGMPFELYQGKNVYDSSTDWQNKVGFMQNPFQLLQLVEMAITLTGRGYLFRERSRAATKSLRYIIPTSVTPKIDPIKGLEYFERPVGATIQRFTTDDIVYFWMPDPYVEIGPALHYPGQAAANACGVLMNIDIFASKFFERGAIKAMLLTVKGMPVVAEREKLETWFQSFIGGVKNSWRAKVVNAEMVQPVVVGEGMKELENEAITQEKREDVALALGIPASILFANSANYATAAQDELNFLNGTIIPECNFIASILNDQIFTPLGLHWEFLPESLDAMQEDEKDRSAALTQLVGALADPISEVAMDILGYELTDEQMNMLRKIWDEKKAQAEQMAQLAAMAPKAEEEKPEEEEPEENVPPQFEEKAKIDLEKWKVKSLKRLREGESAAVEFVSDFIPDERNAEILLKLAECKTADEVRAVFLKYSDDQPRDEAGRWTDGGGGGESSESESGGSSSLESYVNSSDAKLPKDMVNVHDNGPGPSIQYHGSSESFNEFHQDVVYLTTDKSEAAGYSLDLHRMGEIDKGYIYAVRREPGETLNIDSYILDRMNDGDDPDDVINSIIPQAREKGYSYLYYEHPSFIEGGRQQVVISLNPYHDLQIVRKQGYSKSIDPMLMIANELKRANDLLERTSTAEPD